MLTNLKQRTQTFALALAVGAVALAAMPAERASAHCGPPAVLDEQQMAAAGSVGLGGTIRLGQTFSGAVPGNHASKVSVRVVKNDPAAGPLTLLVLKHDFTVLDSATIPGGAIPMGASVQTFDFGCAGGLLVGSPFYGLILQSPASEHGAYAWVGIGTDPYAGPGITRQGWREDVDGDGVPEMLPLADGDWDFTFRIHTRP